MKTLWKVLGWIAAAGAVIVIAGAAVTGFLFIWHEWGETVLENQIVMDRISLSVMYGSVLAGLVGITFTLVRHRQLVRKNQQLLEENERVLEELEKESEEIKDMILEEAQIQQLFRAETTAMLELLQERTDYKRKSQRKGNRNPNTD